MARRKSSERHGGKRGADRGGRSSRNKGRDRDRERGRSRGRGSRDDDDLDDEDEEEFYDEPKDNTALVVGGSVGGVVLLIIIVVMMSGGTTKKRSKTKRRIGTGTAAKTNQNLNSAANQKNHWYNQGLKQGGDYYRGLFGGTLPTGSGFESIMQRKLDELDVKPPAAYKPDFVQGFRVACNLETARGIENGKEFYETRRRIQLEKRAARDAAAEGKE
jgi:hypothetical protein